MLAVEQNCRALPAHMPDFSKPLELLVHCHRKIEGHLRALELAGESLRYGTHDEKLSAFFTIDLARAHFAGPGVKHTEDEEVSLFPRLRERGGPLVEDILAEVMELESQHRTAEIIEAEFQALCALMPRTGWLDAKQVDRFNEVVTVLTTLYRPHIRVENELVFPAAARLLSATDLRLLGEEMRARRQLMLRRMTGAES